MLVAHYFSIDFDIVLFQTVLCWFQHLFWFYSDSVQPFELLQFRIMVTRVTLISVLEMSSLPPPRDLTGTEMSSIME